MSHAPHPRNVCRPGRLAQASAALAFASVLVPVAGVEAREPATTTLVKEVVPTVVFSHKTEGATVWAGIDACRELAANNARISFRFNTRDDTTVAASNESLLGGAIYYPLSRGNTANIDCEEDEDGCVDIAESDITQTAQSVTVGVAFRTLTGITSEAQCADAGVDREYLVRLRIRPDVVTDAYQYAEGRFILDTIRPEPVTNVAATATQTTLRATWELSPSTDVTRHVAVVRDEDFDTSAGNVLPEAVDATINTLARTGEGEGEVSVTLEPDATVYVAVAAEDETGNHSVLSPTVAATVVETVDFWQAYREQGGQEEGGYCQIGALARRPHADASPLGALGAALAGLGGWLVWRRRRGH